MADPIDENDLPRNLVECVNDAAEYLGWSGEEREQELRRQLGHWLIEDATGDAWTREISGAFAELDRLRVREELEQRAEALRERQDALLERKVALAEKYGRWDLLIQDERERGDLDSLTAIIRRKHVRLGQVLAILEDAAGE